MTKDQSPFCYPENIQGEMGGLLSRLAAADRLQGRDADGFSEGVAEFLAYLNAIHPFPEGNGRTQLTFVAELAAHAGPPLDLMQLDPNALLQARIASFFGDEELLRQHIRNLVLA